MNRPRRLTTHAVSVLDALADHSPEWLYGLELSERTGLKSGSLYPILIRLAERGFLESRWLDPSAPGRPRRHAYRIVVKGEQALADARHGGIGTLRERPA